MGALKGLMAMVGIAAVMMGALFMLQGLDIVRWPSSSFMLGDRNWVGYGALIVMGGGALLLLASRQSKS